MNYLDHLLNFSTVEEGKRNLEEALKLRDSMGGALYYSIISDDCMEISRKLNNLIEEEQRKKNNQT